MMKRQTNSKLPIKGIAIGIMVAFIITIILLIIGSSLIVNERVGEEQSVFIAMVALFVSVLIGSLISIRMSEKKPIISFITGGIFWLLLVCIGLLFFEGNMVNILPSLIATVLASGVVCATCMKKPGRKGYKKLRSR